MFGPMRAYGMRDATDGTTNVMFVGEASDFIYNSTGGKVVQVGGAHGIMMGSPNLNYPARCPGCMFERQFNTTTVRYPPNAPAIDNDPNWPGIGDNYGQNNPLRSAHAGGVHILLVDGSVRFLNDNTDMLTVRALATRGDGRRIGDY